MNTNEAQAINDYIAQKNAEFEARCRAEGATFWCVNALTAADLANWYGVHTLEQYIEWEAENDRLEDEKEARKNPYYDYESDQRTDAGPESAWLNYGISMWDA